MEHIVQFGITIDDEAIKNRILENAQKAIVKTLNDEIEQIIFEKEPFGWGTVDKNCASGFTKRQFDKFLEDNRDSIIEMAGQYLADKLVRTKRGKEILENI